MTVTLSLSAYNTILLHSTKYPTSTVLGFLLGSTSTSSTTITQAIPVSHHWNCLSPITEIALSLISAYISSQSTLEIVGIYHNNPTSSTTSSSSSSSNSTIVSAILEKLGSSCISISWIANQVSSKNHGLICHYPTTQSVIVSELDYQKYLSEIVLVGKWKQIIDLDEHLENPQLPWLAVDSVQISL